MGKKRQQYDGGHYSRRGYSKQDLYKGPGKTELMRSQFCEYEEQNNYLIGVICMQNLKAMLAWTGMHCMSQLCSLQKEISHTCSASTTGILGSR